MSGKGKATKQRKVLVNAEVLTQLSDLKHQLKDYEAMRGQVAGLESEVAQCTDLQNTIKTMEGEMHDLRVQLSSAESSGGDAHHKKVEMEEAAKALRVRNNAQVVQIRRLEKLVKAEKGQVAVHRTKVRKLEAELKLAHQANKTVSGLREGLEVDLENKTEEHKREMVQRLMDLHKIDKERQEMEAIREGHARLVEKLETMGQRATRYGNEANALHVALAASDAIVDEYEREVQIQEEVGSDLRLQLRAVQVQDENHSHELDDWKVRCHDMKRMYNEVHAHLVRLVKSHTDRTVLDTAPAARFAGYTTIPDPNHLRRDLVEEPHSTGATHSSIVRTMEGTLISKRQHTDASAFLASDSQASLGGHTASVLTPYGHVGFDSTASRFPLDDPGPASPTGGGALGFPVQAPCCNRATRDGFSLVNTTAAGRPLAAALAEKQLDTFFPIDRHGHSMPLLPSLFSKENSDSGSDTGGGPDKPERQHTLRNSKKTGPPPEAAKRPGALYYGSGLGLKRSGVGLKSAGSAKHILNKILAQLPP